MHLVSYFYLLGGGLMVSLSEIWESYKDFNGKKCLNFRKIGVLYMNQKFKWNVWIIRIS